MKGHGRMYIDELKKGKHMTDNEETVTISLKEYEQLLDDSEWLRALEDAGVDNWEGFEFAKEILANWNMED